MKELSIFLCTAAFLAGTAQAQITNQDDCTNSGTDNVGPGVYAYDNSGATTGTQGQNEGGCYKFGSSGIDNDIWLTYTAAMTGQAIVNTCGTVCDTKLAAWPGAPACPTDGTSLNCNDDTCGLQSQVQFLTTAGTSYIIQVGDFPTAAGCAGTLSISEATPTGNDECTGAIAIAAGTTAANNIGATTSFAWPCAAGGADVWYRYTSTGNFGVTVDTCNGSASYDTALEVFSGDCNNLQSIQCNDDFCGFQSQIAFTTTAAGTDYYIRLGGFGSATGTTDIVITENPPPPPPPPGCTNDRAAFMAACGVISDSEDFSGFTMDVPFGTGPVNIGAGMTIEAFNDIGFRNTIDVAPFQFGDNNGTNNASSFTNQDEPVEILITLGQSAGGFGAEAYDAIGLEMAEMAVMSGGSLIGVCSIATQGPAWVGYTSTVDAVLFRSATLVPGGGGEGFGLDDLTVCSGGPGPIGSPAACMTNPNSTGVASSISAFGSISVAARNVELSCDNVPTGQFGIFFTSTTLGFIPNPGGSNGNICVIGNQGRYNRVTDIFVGAGAGSPVPVGGLEITNDSGTPRNVPINPFPGIPAFTTGMAWYFQGWHRDLGGGDNFSDVLQITFIP